jgi:hypothetical protein
MSHKIFLLAFDHAKNPFISKIFTPCGVLSVISATSYVKSTVEIVAWIWISELEKLLYIYCFRREKFSSIDDNLTGLMPQGGGQAVSLLGKLSCKHEFVEPLKSLSFAFF